MSVLSVTFTCPACGHVEKIGAAAPQVVPTSLPEPQSIPVPPGYGGPIVEGPEGTCPKHLKPWKDGKFGPFCSAKDETQPKGYCSITPGTVWNGKRAAA